MPKRKFAEYTGAERKLSGSSDGALRLQRERLDTILEQAKKTLSRALKVARGFERQKIGRRQKVAKEQKEGAETARLAAEVTALKVFDLVTLAELQLYKTLLKTKRIASAPAFPQYIAAKVQSSLRPQDAAHANVQARLFNSNPVKTALDEIIDRIRKVLGIEDTQPLRKKRIRAADFGSNQSAGNQQLGGKKKSGVVRDEEDQDGSDWHGLSAGESVQEAHHGIRSDDESIDYGMYDSRLTASSDEESGVGNSSEEALQHDKTKMSQDPTFVFPQGLNNRRYSTAKDLLLSPEPDDSPSSPSPPSLTQKAPGKGSSKLKSTTFLPSLAISGYWSGSETTASDLDTADPKPRNNRRGQQERRAIWEKKYGHNANHMKKQSKVQNRDEGWDPRRGARSSDDVRGKRGRGRGRGGMQGGVRAGRGGNLGATGANSDPVLARKTKAAEAPLHPSWDAAKKRKDENRNVAFAGKKIVFN